MLTKRGGTRGRLRAVRLAQLALALLLLPACASGDPELETSADFASRIQVAIDEATAAGASDGQLEALEAAKAAGEVEFSLVRERAYAAVECMVDAGVAAEYYEYTDPGGYTLPAYLAKLSGPDDPATELIADACADAEYNWLSGVYQTQPKAQESQDEYLRLHAAEIRECLNNAGVATEPELAGPELQDRAWQVLGETEGATNCVLGSGVSGD